MLRLRPYKTCDAPTILSWIKDEIAFRKWSADRYDHYPISEDDLNSHYQQFDDTDTFFAWTAYDESGVVGHLIMRFLDEKKEDLRFGFIIVDASKRGKGYGKGMLQLAIQYAFAMLKVKRISLGVFDNNPQAYYCYRSVGLKETKDHSCEYYQVLNENWKCIELEMIKDE